MSPGSGRPADDLWRDLLDDVAILEDVAGPYGDRAAAGRPDRAALARTVADHVEYRTNWRSRYVGPLVVADSWLPAVDRAVGETGAGPIRVRAVNTSGAGGLLSLAGVGFEDLELASVHSRLRDPDEPAGNARRIARAAEELSDVEVYVEIPPIGAWRDAVTVIETAGLCGAVSLADEPAAVAGQLFAFVEADLPFVATRVPSLQGERGLASLLLTVLALADGATPDDAAALLGCAAGDLPGIDDLTGIDGAAAARIRRRLRGVGGLQPAGLLDDLRTAGVIKASDPMILEEP